MTNEIVPKIKLDPALSAMATPRPINTMTGSAQESVEIANTQKTKAIVTIVMIWISATVLVVPSAVLTALPDNALLSPMMARISATAET